MGVKKRMALLLFRTITGSNYTAFFNTVGKLKFWNTWGLVPSSCSLTYKTFSANCESRSEDVNEAKEKMFTTGLMLFENLPPT